MISNSANLLYESEMNTMMDSTEKEHSSRRE
jgi:hypothetical protein